MGDIIPLLKHTTQPGHPPLKEWKKMLREKLSEYWYCVMSHGVFFLREIKFIEIEDTITLYVYI